VLPVIERIYMCVLLDFNFFYRFFFRIFWLADTCGPDTHNCRTANIWCYPSICVPWGHMRPMTVYAAYDNI
jgi:hypothetical protein